MMNKLYIALFDFSRFPLSGMVSDRKIVTANDCWGLDIHGVSAALLTPKPDRNNFKPNTLALANQIRTTSEQRGEI